MFNGEGQNASFNRDSTVLFVGRVVARPLPHVSVGASGTARGDDSTRIQLEAGVEHAGLALRGEYVRLERDEDGSRDEGWYGLATCRSSMRPRPGRFTTFREEGCARGSTGST